MAYVFSSKETVGGSSASTITVDLPKHQNGDLLLVFVGNDYSSNIYGAVPSGWFEVARYDTGGDPCLIIGYYATSSSTTSPTITSSAAVRTHVATAISVRGAATSSAIDVVSSTVGSVYRGSTQSVTTTVANTLVFEYIQGKSNSKQLFYEPSVQQIAGVRENSYSYMIGVFNHSDVGATPVHYFANHYSSTNTVRITFAIKDDGNGVIKGGVSPYNTPCDVMTPFLGSISSTYYDDSTKYVDPTSLISTVKGVATNYYPTASYSDSGYFYPISPRGFNISSSTQWKKYLVAQTGLANTFNLSGSKVSFTVLGGQFRPVPYDVGGRWFGVGSGDSANVATAAKLYLFEAGDAKVTTTSLSGKQTFVISADKASDESYGSIDLTNINKLFIGTYVTTSGYQNLGLSMIVKHKPMIMLAGSAVKPCSMDDASSFTKTNILNTIQNQSGSAKSQYFSAHDIQVGDGTRSTYWDSSYQSVEYPSAYSQDNINIGYYLDSGDFEFRVKASANDTVKMISGTFDMGDYHNWVIDPDSANVDLYDFTGMNILNASVTLQDKPNIGYTGITFSGCKELTTNGADLSGGNTISNCVDAQAITVTSQAEFQKLANCTFRNNTVAIKITGNQTGTWTDANLTVSGNTYDIEYAGTTNFSIQSASTLTVNNSSTGTLTIVTPTFDLVVNSSEAASQINVFSTGTQTIIDTAASASSLTYTHSGETVDITVLKDGYIPFRQTGVVLSGSVTIDVQLVKSREYLASHGLTYTTDASWDRSTNKLTVPTWGVTGQQVFSLIMEAFKSQTSLRNTAFNLQMDGANSLYLVNGAEGASDASITNMIECGVAYLDSAGTTTASWVGVKSVGTATGFTGEYQQDAGGVLSGTVDARATGIFNQLIKMYGDVTHGNFDYTGHLVLKYQPNGYREVRSDVLEAYGISTLSPTLYIVAMQPVAIAATTGDPALTLTITDHGATPVTWNSKDFSITVVADATDSGENILRELNYNLSLDATYQGKDPFNWPEMVIEAGTDYETKRGITEGGTGAALKGVRVIDGSGNPHPDFTRMQADDGTYYVVPVTANISISNLPDDLGGNTRLQIYNITTDTLIYSGDPAGTSYSDSYTDGDLAYASAGNNIRIRFAHANAGTSFEYGQTIVQATSSGIVADGNNFIVAEPVYATNGIDGSTITKFSYTPVNDQFNLIINSNFLASEMFAFYCYTLTTADGIQGAYGAFVAQDAGNYKNITSITSIYLDNETTASKRQTDTSRIYRDDGAYPVLEPTTSGFGIDINWQNVVYVVTAGSGLTAPQAAELTQAAQAATVNTKIGTPSVTVSDDIAAISAGGDATQAKQDTILANLATVDSIVDAILVDTGTDIPASIAALTAPDNASIASIKAKTDQLTFTKANELDANIQSVNDVTVNGTGATGSEWGP